MAVIEDQIESINGNSIKLKTARIGLNNPTIHVILNGKQNTFQVAVIFFTTNNGIKQTVITLHTQDVAKLVPEMTIYVIKETSECIPCRKK